MTVSECFVFRSVEVVSTRLWLRSLRHERHTEEMAPRGVLAAGLTSPSACTYKKLYMTLITAGTVMGIRDALT